MKINPIGIENQIKNLLEGESEEEKNLVGDKIEFVKSNVGKIDRINGSRVFDVSIDGDKLRYNLQRTGIPENQKYYYPIQYAQISVIQDTK